MKVRRVTLRLSIVSIYVITFVLLMSLLILMEYWTLKKFIAFTSTNLLTNTTALVMQELKSKGSSAENISQLSKNLFENGFIDADQLVNYLLYASQNTTTFQLNIPTKIVSWIEPQGNSISTYLEPDGTYSTVIYRPYEDPPMGVKFYRNQNNVLIKNVYIPAVDLRKSPSWSAATKAKRFNWTDVFFSIPEKNLTTTAVAPVYDKANQLKGVFTVNLAMQGVSDFLKTLKIGKNGFAFMINGKDELIAFPGMDKQMDALDGNALINLQAINKPWLVAALSEFKKIKKPLFTFTYNHDRYIAHITQLPEDLPEVAQYAWKVGVVVPEEDFTGDLERKKNLLLSFGVLILLCGILIASIVSKLITTRIKMLVEETKRIKNFNFEGKKVKSHIKEVYLLSNAIHSMKMNLRSFKKYVPANLVQQLIKSGLDIHLGGDVRILSIMFSDIKNFTTISETLSPDQLMLDLSEYLDNLSTIITSKQGTIDKFIGDSIMAFWSAPLTDLEHCKHACQTALLCRDKIKELNQKWMQQGKEAFITRFGVHTGEVIVGNIGSSDRMNYTAIGDSINLTSRLEGLNKTYDTSIMVSEKVVEQVKDSFVFRKIDVTTIKGKTGGHTVYELLAEKVSELPFDFKAYQTYFEQGFAAYQHQDWNEAIESFKKALKIHKEDEVAKVFILRCRQFKKKPPSKDWDGVWRG